MERRRIIDVIEDWTEPAAIFTAIMAYIWAVRYRYPWMVFVIVAVMIVSHYVRHETPFILGFRRDNFKSCANWLFPPVALLSLLLVATGFLLHTMRTIRFDLALAGWAIYLPWGVTQQYVLSGYFLRRTEKISPHRAAPFISAALFSLAHLPNTFLMAVTLAGGIICTQLYRRCPNLFVLGLVHGTIGFLLYLVVPDSISHHLRVGRGWYTWR
jgi:membrane protease YdiL (CAAX protease family)